MKLEKSYAVLITLIFKDIMRKIIVTPTKIDNS